MKARIKATGEIAEFSTGKNLQGQTILLKVGTASIFLLNEVEPINDVDYNQVRIQASIAAMQGITPEWGNSARQYAEWAVRIADALVAELKKGGEL